MIDGRHLLFEIGGIVFAFISNVPLKQIYVNRLRDFPGAGIPDVTIHLHYDGVPPFHLAERDLLFDSGAVWKLYQHGKQHIFTLQAPAASKAPYCVAVFDARFTQGDLFVETTPNRTTFALEYPPLSEVLMVCLLAQQQGVMVHACGVYDKERGYLFAGNSTHGKSTMARLWKDEAVILNDDRIILRQHDGRLWMYGTPWHSSYDGVSALGVPVDTVFFLRHAPFNQVALLRAVDAMSTLLTHSFPAFWDTEGMRYTLDFINQIVESVPCYDLGFVPDHEIINYVRCVKSI